MINQGSALYNFRPSVDGSIEVGQNDITKTLPVGDKRLAIAVTNLVEAQKSNSPALKKVADQLAAMPAKQLADAAKKMAPQNTVAAPDVAVRQQALAFETVSNRIAGLRPNSVAAATGITGVSGGDTALEKAMWIQAYGVYRNQGERKGVDGYDSRTYGLTVGIDAQTDPIDTVGAFFTYADSNIDSDGIGNDNLDIDNYSFGIYGAKSFGQAYLEMMGSVGFNDYSGKRVTIGNEVASRDYDGMQYAVSTEVGHAYNVADGFLFTPKIGLQYTQVDDNNYREKGAGAALKVGSRSSKSLRSAIGFDSSYVIDTIDGPVYTTLLSATWKHEINEWFQRRQSELCQQRRSSVYVK